MSALLTLVAALGMVLGGLDCIFHTPLKLGDEFRKGIGCIAAMTVNMAGILVVAPIIVEIVKPITVFPLFRIIDPAMIGTLFSTDMGGYEISKGLAADRSIGLFASVVMTSMFGGLFSYIIPVGGGLLNANAKPTFYRGLLAGMLVLPFTSVLSALMMGVALVRALLNLIPVFILTGILIFLLVRKPGKINGFFSCLTKIIGGISVIGLALGGVELVTGYKIFPSQMDFLSAMVVPIRIAVMLMGLLPVIKMISPLTKRVFSPLTDRLGMTSSVIDGMLIATLTAVPVFLCMNDMNDRARSATAAWMVGAMGVFSSHYTYILSAEPCAVGSLVAAKLLTGCCAFILSLFLSRSERKK